MLHAAQNNSTLLLDDFNQTIDTWIKALDDYDFDQLCAQPTPHSWSMGQVYMHLIHNTNYYIEQIKICVATNDNALEEAASGAKTMFLNNDFPDEVIEGPPSNDDTPQPASKEQLVRCLMDIKDEINNLGTFISTSACKGKTKHPGLHYFNASEWLQFGEMHMRHHLRQKKRIDEFLKKKSA